MLSSAYVIKLNILMTCGKSCIYIINNKGPRIEPCGTHVDLLLVGFLIAFLKFQHTVVGCLNNFQINVNVEPSMP